MKKLNNKGFTLIELLAVVVILAVVMGIAMSSVLGSMNKARGGSLADTASVIANQFLQKYTESLVDGVPTNVYGGNDPLATGYNFSTSGNYYLDSKLADTFKISPTGYALADGHATVSGAVTNSFVSYNSSTGKFIVCMIAKTTGSYFVDAYKVTAATKLGQMTNGVPSTDASIKDVQIAAGNMVACSDGTKSWK